MAGIAIQHSHGQFRFAQLHNHCLARVQQAGPPRFGQQFAQLARPPAEKAAQLAAAQTDAELVELTGER
jgi:hypothetical protein